MVKKDYKEIKINRINDLRIGDITFTSDAYMGTIIKIGETLLHKHPFVKVMFIIKYPGCNNSYTEKFKIIYEDNFIAGEIVLRQSREALSGESQ